MATINNRKRSGKAQPALHIYAQNVQFNANPLLFN